MEDPAQFAVTAELYEYALRERDPDQVERLNRRTCVWTINHSSQ